VPTGRFHKEIERLVSIIADQGERLICVHSRSVVCYGDPKRRSCTIMWIKIACL
jgi:hypothetical protein